VSLLIRYLLHRNDILFRVLYCDHCGDIIRRSRVFCLDCDSPQNWSNSVDFCRKVECHDCGELPDHRKDEFKEPHTKAHLLLKVRERLLLKDYFATKTQAKWKVANALQVYEPPPANASSTPTANVADGEDTTAAKAEAPIAVSPTTPTSANSLASGRVIKEQMATPPDSSMLAAFPGKPNDPDATIDAVLSVAATTESTPERPSDAEQETGGDDANEGASSDGEESDEPSLLCMYCHTRVITPCWSCVDCTCEFFSIRSTVVMIASLQLGMPLFAMLVRL
jgi:hypothetical protein